jgi:hypothetical protein
MKHKMWQIIYKDYGKLDDDFGYNKECSQNIFETAEEAWKEVIADCANDEDITYVLSNVASGVISLKEVLVPETETETQNEDCTLIWKITVNGYGLQKPPIMFKEKRDAMQWITKTYPEDAVDFLNNETITIDPVRIYNPLDDQDD